MAAAEAAAAGPLPLLFYCPPQSLRKCARPAPDADGTLLRFLTHLCPLPAAPSAAGSVARELSLVNRSGERLVGELLDTGSQDVAILCHGWVAWKGGRTWSCMLSAQRALILLLLLHALLRPPPAPAHSHSAATSLI